MNNGIINDTRKKSTYVLVDFFLQEEQTLRKSNFKKSNFKEIKL